jgi:hypothetical protein
MTDKKTPEDLAEIFVFEHAHDQFGLSKQECYVAGYNAASQETSLLREDNKRLRNWMTEYLTQLKQFNVYHQNQGIINSINEALNPKQ